MPDSSKVAGAVSYFVILEGEDGAPKGITSVAIPPLDTFVLF
jgi:hypothetical protein